MFTPITALSLKSQSHTGLKKEKIVQFYHGYLIILIKYAQYVQIISLTGHDQQVDLMLRPEKGRCQ